MSAPVTRGHRLPDAPARLKTALPDAQAEVWNYPTNPILERFAVKGFRTIDLNAEWRVLSTGVSVSEAVDKAIMLWGKQR